MSDGRQQYVIAVTADAPRDVQAEGELLRRSVLAELAGRSPEVTVLAVDRAEWLKLFGGGGEEK